MAILSDADFDALDVDPATVRLSGASAKTQKGTVKVTEQDVNQDGLTDIVLQMITEELLLDKNSTHAVLTGKTKSGTAIGGMDSVVVVQIRE